MKSQLNKYRQYTISDYLINTDKFKDYLKFCLKYDLKNEKKYLMDNLLRTLQFKENCGNQKLLSELRKLSTLIIIFSDFEVELLFTVNYLIFNPDIQKKIFYEVRDYLNRDENGNNEEIKNYMNIKFYFWILKLSNQNFSSINEVKDTILVEKEVNESIQYLKNITENITDEIFESEKKNKQLLLIKIIYELSLYFFFKDENDICYKYLCSLVYFYGKYIQKYSADISNENKEFYFDIKNIKALIKYYENEKNQNNENMDIDRNENNINNYNKNNIFDIDEIINYENIINDDYINHQEEIDKAKIDYMNNLNSSNSNSLNEIDYYSKNCMNSFINCLKISKFLTYKSLTEYDYHKIAFEYTISLQNKIKFKIKSNNNRKDDNNIQYINKEIEYILNLLDLIEKVNNNKEKLDKNFLKNLSEFILTNTLTGDLRLSGLIHSYMINFSFNIKKLCPYFSNFVKFFEETTNIYKDETIKQINFINQIVKIFYDVIDKKNKLSLPLDKEISITYDESTHIDLINIFLYWLTGNDLIESDEIKKQNQKKIKQKKNLKFPHSINIIFIFIESLKNLEFLKILKIIVSSVLNFILHKKHYDNLEFSSDLVETLYDSKPRLLNSDMIFDGIIRDLKLIIDDTTYNINIKLNFIENKNKEKYKIKIDNMNLYIKILFNALEKIDVKINKLEYINHISNNIQNNNLNDEKNKNIEYIIDIKKYDFMRAFYYSIEMNSSKNNNEVKISIINGINYFKFSFENYKNNYMKIDFMSDSIKIKKNYEIFKSLIDQDILYQIILCFIKEKRYLDSLILLQYSKKFNKEIAYKLLKNICDKNDFINYESLKYIWKLSLFEYLANFYSKKDNFEAINKINMLIKRISNHQFFRGHAIRKNFKIFNFLNFIDYLNNIKYNI